MRITKAWARVKREYLLERLDQLHKMTTDELRKEFPAIVRQCDSVIDSSVREFLLQSLMRYAILDCFPSSLIDD